MKSKNSLNLTSFIKPKVNKKPSKKRVVVDENDFKIVNDFIDSFNQDNNTDSSKNDTLIDVRIT